MLTLLGTAALRPAAASPAVVETHTPFSSVFLFNPCIGEFIAIQGFVHTKVHVDTTADKTHFSTEFNWQDMKGVGLTSGATYVVVNAQSVSVNVSAPFPQIITVEQSVHFIRQGEDGTLVLEDDFHVKTKFHFTVNANGVVTVNKNEFTVECR
jgi:hypothetical protein